MDVTTVQERRLVLLSREQSVGEARHFVRSVLAEWECAALTEVAELLVSELATNAILHTSTDLVIVVCQLGADEVMIGVADAEATEPEVVSVGSEAECGRGLVLVDALADSWGYEPCGSGKLVYAELKRQ